MNGLARNAPIFVLDRRDRLVAKARVVRRIFGLPKGSHDRIATSTDEPIAIGLVDEQAGKFRARSDPWCRVRAGANGRGCIRDAAPSSRRKCF